jgi:hypothetical protein
MGLEPATCCLQGDRIASGSVRGGSLLSGEPTLPPHREHSRTVANDGVRTVIETPVTRRGTAMEFGSSTRYKV